MLGSVSEVAVLVSAILAVAVGSIWYSPVLFGKQLSKSTRHVFDDTEVPQSVFIKRIGAVIFAYVVFLTLVAQFIPSHVSDVLSLIRDSVLLFGLLVAFFFTLVILEKRSVVYFLIHVGYVAIVFFGGLVVIAKWPW